MPQSLSTGGTLSNTIRIPVPAGTTARRVLATLVVDTPEGGGAEDGAVAIRMGDREVRRVSADRAKRRMVLPVTADLVDDDGSVSISARYLPGDGRGCDSVLGGVTVSLTDIVLDFTGREQRPTTPGTFLPDLVNTVQVVVPDAPSSDVVDAALTAVAALAGRYPAPTKVEVVRPTGVEDQAYPGLRVVRIEEGSASQLTSVSAPGGVPTLTVSGSGTALSDAARALGSDGLKLSSAARVTDLDLTEPASDPDTELTLADFGPTTIGLGGWGVSRAYVGLAQDYFGGPVDSMTLDLSGVHTPADGITSHLDAYVNDRLVASTVLDDDPELEMTIDVDRASMVAENGLELVLTTLPPEGTCRLADGRGIPVTLEIDGNASTISATRGTGSVSGFGMFPQVLGHDLPVAMRDTAATGGVDQVRLAGQVVASLQRAAAAPLDVRVVGADELVDGTDSGLLVGATTGDTDALGAPLRLDRMRLVDFAEQEFGMGDGSPFAALQTVVDGGRAVLVLGSWSDGGAGATTLMSSLGSTVSGGWRNLREDLLVATPAQDTPFLVSTDSVLPQDAEIEESRDFMWWIVGGAAAVVLLVLLGYLVLGRRDREIRDLVRAQERSETEEV